MQPTVKPHRAARRAAFGAALASASPDDPTPILSAARAAGVPRSSAYRYAGTLDLESERESRQPLTPRQLRLTARIVEEWERSHRISGAAKIHAAIRRTEVVGHNLVASLMRRAGLVGAYNAPKVARERDVAPDTVKGEWHAEGRKVLASDTMQFRASDGNLFVAGTVDCDSRRLSVATSSKNNTDLTTASIRDAVRNVALDPGVSVTALSDQGPQYTAAPYVATLDRLGVERANTPVHCPTRNSIIEGDWSVFRREFPRFVLAHTGKRIRQLSVRALKPHMRDYVRWYNESRTHASLGYRSPAEFERAARDERRAILAQWDHARSIARAERHAEIEARTEARAARVIASLVQCAPRLASAPIALAA